MKQILVLVRMRKWWLCLICASWHCEDTFELIREQWIHERVKLLKPQMKACFLLIGFISNKTATLTCTRGIKTCFSNLILLILNQEKTRSLRYQGQNSAHVLKLTGIVILTNLKRDSLYLFFSSCFNLSGVDSTTMSTYLNRIIRTDDWPEIKMCTGLIYVLSITLSFWWNSRLFFNSFCIQQNGAMSHPYKSAAIYQHCKIFLIVLVIMCNMLIDASMLTFGCHLRNQV